MIFSDDFARLFELAGLLYMKSRRVATRVLARFGVTWDQFGALLVLAGASGLSQKSLAVALETDTTTAMVICEGLERKGLITRTRDPSNRRAYVLAVSSRGKGVTQRGWAAMETIWTPLRGTLTPGEIAAALPVLQKAAEAVRTLAAKTAKTRTKKGRKQ